MPKAARRLVVNPDTGETRTHLIEREQRQPYSYPKDDHTGKRHMTLGAVAARRVIEARYGMATVRVLLHLVYTTDKTCVIRQTQTQIAAATGLTQGAVSKAFKQLAADLMIYRQGTTWNLAPNVGYTGTGSEHTEAVARMNEHLSQHDNVIPLPVG